MFVTTRKLLLDAQRGGYAVGAFNAENMEMAQAIIFAAQELDAPVIVQTVPATVRYGGLSLYVANVRALAEYSKIPVALNLDHSESFDLIAQAIREGYTSVMYDGSHFDFEANIAMTKRIVEMAAPNNIPVEAELGKVAGREDDMDGGGIDEGNYTSPSAAAEFVAKTGVSSLAVAIGTAHGHYDKKPVLDIKRLKQIRERVSVPLVLHGASGLPDEDIMNCVKSGICKINFSTELRAAYTEGVKSVLNDNPKVIDPKVYGNLARERVKEVVKSKILMCGCSGKGFVTDFAY